MKARLRSEAWPLLLILLAAVLFFWKTTLTGKVLLPVDNLYQFPPWSSYAPEGFTGAHNPLISDSILENYGWKRILIDSIRQRQLPLWNPYILGGTPFLAPGQASVLYPFTLLWLILPLARAYAYFAAIHLFLAGACAYVFLRVSGASRPAGLLAGLTYMFSTRLVTSVLWPQMMGAVVYLPLLLGLLELIVRQSKQRWPVLPALAAALVLGLSVLAGHIEASVYVMAAMGLYILGRLGTMVPRREARAVRALASSAASVVLGCGLAAIQLLPFYEVGSLNFRSGAVSYQDVAGFALKLPQLFTFLMPDFYGNPTIHWAPYWGPKDYVEQASYVGVLPLLLAAATLLMLRNGQIATLWGIIAVSLLLAFGTPLYRVVFFLLPGFNQIHSPFRWLIPYTAAMALLAGFGFDRVRARLGGARLWFGAAFAAVLAGAALWWLAVLPRVPAGTYGLEVRNYAILLGLALASAFIAWTGRRAFSILAVALVAADLAYFGVDFNTAADPRLLQTTPELVRFLQQDRDVFRVTAYGRDKMFEANGNVLYGIQDARGYDSVIVGRYARLNELLEPQDQLQFNRVKTLDRPGALKSPVLNLLNVKYVVTREEIGDPQFELVYAGPDGRVYRNRDVLPRAFVAGDVRVGDLSTLAGVDPSRTAVVDRPVQETSGSPSPGAKASVELYSGRKVLVRATGPGLLVLTDNNFPGWKATVDGQPADLLTADYTFRGVPLPAGEHLVEFVFAPTTVLVGGLISGLSVALVVVLAVAHLWRRSPATEAHAVRRVTKNSLTPLASNVASKLLNFGFSIYYFRVLGLTQVGKYVLAATIWLFLDTIISFGLQQLVSRDVARDKSRAGEYIANAIAVRLMVTAAVGVPVAIGALALGRYFGFDQDTAVVIVILVATFVPSAFAAVFSHVFDAHELMEYKAFVQVLTTIVNIALGAGFILAGWNIIGLALASLLTNMFTAAAFWVLISRAVVRPRLELDGRLIRSLVRGAYPIMLNQLLTVFFFKIDVPLLRAFRNNDEVGIYGAAYKFVDAMLLVPATFIPAVFPILSRQAASQREALKRGTDLSLKVLLLIALPLVAGFEVFADDIIRGFYGPSFGPAALALRILILFLPFSYVNGLTQYVLIALDKQRLIIRFFALTAAFNVLVNLALIPRFGYVAASAVTVGSEVVLLGPLWWLTARELGGALLLSVVVRPMAAALLAGVSMLALRGPAAAALGDIAGPLLAAVCGLVVYGLALLALRTFSEEELALVKRALRPGPPLAGPLPAA
jgi:O-antigen/teichoic acid export membrane protein